MTEREQSEDTKTEIERQTERQTERQRQSENKKKNREANKACTERLPDGDIYSQPEKVTRMMKGDGMK